MDRYIEERNGIALTVRSENAEAHRREKARTKIRTFFAKLREENPEVIEVHWAVNNGD